jgi:DNA-directed RNA polymerase specialized sigma24 family protein
MLEAARSGDPPTRREAMERLGRAYWHPAHAYLRWRWSLDGDSAQDLLQDFFAHALEDGTFARHDASRARFRTFLRVCLDHFVANAHKAAGRLKRGGKATVLPLDEALLGGEEALGSADPEADRHFHHEWVRAVFTEAVERLRSTCEARGKELPFAVFRRHDLETGDGEDAPSYAELSEAFGIPVTQVTNYLAWCRREFRSAVLGTLRDRAPSEEEYRGDARELLGVRVP